MPYTNHKSDYTNNNIIHKYFYVFNIIFQNNFCIIVIKLTFCKISILNLSTFRLQSIFTIFLHKDHYNDIGIKSIIITLYVEEVSNVFRIKIAVLTDIIVGVS